jgi:hypothetical protein
VLEEDASLAVGRAAEAAGAAAAAAAGAAAAGAAAAAALSGISSEGGQGGSRRASAATSSGRPLRRGRRAGPGQPDGDATPDVLEVVSVEVLPAPEEPLAAVDLDQDPDGAGGGPDQGTASDWLPGIRDEHDDMPLGGGLEGPGRRGTWSRSVTPNVIRRTGTRPPRRRR